MLKSATRSAIRSYQLHDLLLSFLISDPLLSCVAPLNAHQVDENLRRVRGLHQEVQAGVSELQLPQVDFEHLRNLLDSANQEGAAMVSDLCLTGALCDMERHGVITILDDSFELLLVCGFLIEFIRRCGGTC